MKAPTLTTMTLPAFRSTRLFGILALLFFSNAKAAEPIGNAAENELFDILVVTDSDGFANVRSSPSAQGDIVGCIRSGTPLFADDLPNTPNGWAQIRPHQKLYQRSCADSSKTLMEFFDSDSDSSQIFIHQSRRVRLTSLDTLRRIAQKDAKSFSVAKFDSFEIKLSHRKFNPKHHRIAADKLGATYVDGKYAWGTDCTLPSYETTQFELSHSSIPIQVNRTWYQNLYELRLTNATLFAAGNQYYYLTLQASDGAAGYIVILTIHNNKIINISSRLSIFA